jgi:ArsR family transcriptional regulator
MSSATAKKTILASLAGIAQAIGHPHRLELLEQLGQGAHSVEDLATRTGMSVANTSRHLQILRRASVVTARRDGKRVLYALDGEANVVALLKALGRVGEHNAAEMQRVLATYFHARDAQNALKRADVSQQLAHNGATLLDVRPAEEFKRGHIATAVNIPWPGLKKQLTALPKDRAIIVYCRGPYSVLAYEAVSLLRSAGYSAHRLEDGFPEWKAAGLPVEGGLN